MEAWVLDALEARPGLARAAGEDILLEVLTDVVALTWDRLGVLLAAAVATWEVHPRVAVAA